MLALVAYSLKSAKLLTLSYMGGGGGGGGGEGGRIPPLLTLVLNSTSSIQAIVLMFGDVF